MAGQMFVEKCRQGAAVAFDSESGMFWPLTPCCQASAKGSGSGVVCRACFAEVPEVLGLGAMLSEGEAAVAAMVEAVQEKMGCPVPASCSVHTVWTLLSSSSVEVTA